MWTESIAEAKKFYTLSAAEDEANRLGATTSTIWHVQHLGYGEDCFKRFVVKNGELYLKEEVK